MRLALDHHFSRHIAAGLRDRGHDVVGAFDRDWHVLPDEELLEVCGEDRRALLTNNVAHFDPIARRWAMLGRTHHGLVFTADSSMPRTSAAVGSYIRSLGALMRDHPDERALVDQIVWLRRG